MYSADARFLRVVDPRVLIAAFLQFLHALFAAIAQGFEVAKLNGLSRARFRACRSQSRFLAVVTERTFECTTVGWPLVDHAKGTGDDTIAATVANIGLHKHRAEFGAHNRSRGACFKAAGVGAVLAHIGKKNPAERVFRIGHLRARDLWFLQEQNVPPGGSSQAPGLVVRHSAP